MFIYYLTIISLMAKTLDQIKVYAIKLRKDLNPLLEGQGVGYDSLERLFDNISRLRDSGESLDDDKRAALAYLGGIRERVQKIIFSLDAAKLGRKDSRFDRLSSKLKPFLIKIDTFMLDC